MIVDAHASKHEVLIRQLIWETFVQRIPHFEPLCFFVLALPGVLPNVKNKDLTLVFSKEAFNLIHDTGPLVIADEVAVIEIVIGVPYGKLCLFLVLVPFHAEVQIASASTKLLGQRYTALVAPARITDARTKEERLMFPGSREELVERALRFIAVQQIAKTKLTPDAQTGAHAITVFFTLSMIRRHLEEIGHGYKLSAIKEALDILSDTSIEIRLDSDTELAQGKRRRFMKGTILANNTGDFLEKDVTGEESRAAVTFHPLASQAILATAFYPINQLRVGKLKRHLARWLTTRMSHNYRQARRNGFVQDDGYHISLETILEERGLQREKRL
jgi:hypothetical protein